MSDRKAGYFYEETNILFMCLLFTVGTFCCSCGGGDKDLSNGVTLKIGVSTGETDPRNIAAKEFADEIEKESGGKLKAEIHPSGELGGDAEMIDALAINSGTIDIVITDASNFATYEGTMGISALPFLFDDFETAWEFMDSDIEAEAEKKLVDKNMRVLAHYCNGFRCVTNSKRPIKSPDDMKNLLIRTPQNPVIMDTMTALGANPQPLSFSELYDALRQKTYDAQENPIPVIYNNKLYEVQKYLSVTNHIYSGMCFTISEKIWSRLSEEQKKIIQTAAENSAKSDRENNKKQTEELLQTLKDNGMQVNEPDTKSFAKKTKSVIDKNASAYGRLLDRLNAWLKEKD